MYVFIYLPIYLKSVRSEYFSGSNEGRVDTLKPVSLRRLCQGEKRSSEHAN